MSTLRNPNERLPYRNPRVMVNLLCGLSLIFFKWVYEVEGGLGGTHATPGNILFRSELSVTPPKNLRFSAGDIISCPINGVANHMLLALSSTETAETYGGSGLNSKADIRVGEFDSDGNRNCKVDTKRFDELMFFTVARTSYSTEEAVKRARNDGGKRVFYDLIGCNCEHWVTYWKYGVPLSFQSIPGTIAKCPI
jgi:hypothetical protein